MYNLSELSIRDLLSLTIKESAVSEVLAQFPTARDIASATPEELVTIKGIGPVQAQRLLSSIELGKRIYSAPPEQPVIIRCPQDVYDLLKEMALLDREVFRCVNLSTKNHVLAIDTVSIGSLNSSPVHPRELFKLPIKRSAAAIVIAHNHPSGSPEPSNEDLSVTQRLVEAGKLLGIELFDHVIIGHQNYSSLKEKGAL